MHSAIRMSRLSLLAGLAIAATCGALAFPPGQKAPPVEITAKSYEFNPSVIHVKQGARVQLKITALDKTHGFTIGLYPDGAKATGSPGLVFASQQACFDLEKGTPTIVEFVAQTPGTYSFKCCRLCGVGHRGMKGSLVVEA